MKVMARMSSAAEKEFEKDIKLVERVVENEVVKVEQEVVQDIHRIEARISTVDSIHLEAEKEIDHRPDPNPEYSQCRRRVRNFLQNRAVEYGLSIIILANTVLLAVETDLGHDKLGDEYTWAKVMNGTLTAFFGIELMVRIYVYRVKMLHDPWAFLDASVIASDVIFTLLNNLVDGMPSVSMMRIIRLLRLAKTTEIMELIPELNMIVHTLIGAVKPLVWGIVFLFLILTIWAILAVQLINPLSQELFKMGVYEDCDRCTRAYSTVPHAMLTFCQQIIAADNWGEGTLPLIEYYPLTAPFFFAVFVSMNMALMNIIMASVVDAVAQSRKHNEDFVSDNLKKERALAKHKLMSICQRMDTDGSGTLTYEEIEQGWKKNRDFRTSLESMDLQKEDISSVWGILDEDGSGDVSHEEFCEQLFKMKSSDPHTMLMFVKHYVSDIRKSVTASLVILEKGQGDVERALEKEEEQLEKAMKSMDQEKAEMAEFMQEEKNSNGFISPQYSPMGSDKVPVLDSIVEVSTKEAGALSPEAKFESNLKFDEDQQRFLNNFMQSMAEIERRFEAHLSSFGSLSSLASGSLASAANYPLMETHKQQVADCRSTSKEVLRSMQLVTTTSQTVVTNRVQPERRLGDSAGPGTRPAEKAPSIGWSGDSGASDDNQGSIPGTQSGGPATVYRPGMKHFHL